MWNLVMLVAQMLMLQIHLSHCVWRNGFRVTNLWHIFFFFTVNFSVINLSFHQIHGNLGTFSIVCIFIFKNFNRFLKCNEGYHETLLNSNFWASLINFICFTLFMFESFHFYLILIWDTFITWLKGHVYVTTGNIKIQEVSNVYDSFPLQSTVIPFMNYWVTLNDLLTTGSWVYIFV